MNLKTAISLTICILLGSLLYTFFSNQSLTMLTLINHTFLVSLACTSIGAALFVVQGGLFNGIAYSFKRFFARVSKNGAYAYELDGNLEFTQAPTYSFTYPLLLAGTLGCLITTILSVVLY